MNEGRAFARKLCSNSAVASMRRKVLPSRKHLTVKAARPDQEEEKGPVAWITFLEAWCKVDPESLFVG